MKTLCEIDLRKMPVDHMFEMQRMQISIHKISELFSIFILAGRSDEEFGDYLSRFSPVAILAFIAIAIFSRITFLFSQFFLFAITYCRSLSCKRHLRGSQRERFFSHRDAKTVGDSGDCFVLHSWRDPGRRQANP
jgi:hypothetical protein